jgi:hypothetical protein
MTFREFFNPRFTQSLMELMSNKFETEKAIEIDDFYEDRKKKFEQFQKVSKEQLLKFNGEIIENKLVFHGKNKEKDEKDYSDNLDRFLDKDLDFPITKIPVKVDYITSTSISLLKIFFEFERKNKEKENKGVPNA